MCHLNVRSHGKLWFNLPCKTAVWLQEIWIIKRTTRRLSLWAQQGIPTPQTKNMRLDYEEWMRAVSQQRRAAFLCCRGTCSQWRFKKKYLKRKRRCGWCFKLEKSRRGQLKDRADVSAWCSQFTLPYLTFPSFIFLTFLWVFFFFFWASKQVLISIHFKLVIQSIRWLWSCWR